MLESNVWLCGGEKHSEKSEKAKRVPCMPLATHRWSQAEINRYFLRSMDVNQDLINEKQSADLT